MARTVDEILAQMATAKASKTELNGLDSPSQVSRWNLFLYIVAVCTAVFEQVLDIRNTAVENLVAASKPSTPAYIKHQVLNLFQYDATTPQVLILNNFAPTYAIINTDLNIITRCSISTLGDKSVEIKVAKENPPVPIIAGESAALSTFLDNILPPGISYNLISVNPDNIYVEADVIYNGTYAPTIQDNVKTALTDFYGTLSSDISFNGVLLVSDIEKVIKNTEGVIDVVIKKVYGREDSATFVAGTKIFDLSLGINLGSYQMYAGYGVEETTSGKTLNDSLNFVVG